MEGKEDEEPEMRCEESAITWEVQRGALVPVPINSPPTTDNERDESPPATESRLDLNRREVANKPQSKKAAPFFVPGQKTCSASALGTLGSATSSQKELSSTSSYQTPPSAASSSELPLSLSFIKNCAKQIVSTVMHQKEEGPQKEVSTRSMLMPRESRQQQRLPQRSLVNKDAYHQTLSSNGEDGTRSKNVSPVNRREEHGATTVCYDVEDSSVLESTEDASSDTGGILEHAASQIGIDGDDATVIIVDDNEEWLSGDKQLKYEVLARILGESDTPVIIEEDDQHENAVSMEDGPYSVGNTNIDESDRQTSSDHSDDQDANVQNDDEICDDDDNDAEMLEHAEETECGNEADFDDAEISGSTEHQRQQTADIVSSLISCQEETKMLNGRPRNYCYSCKTRFHKAAFTTHELRNTYVGLVKMPEPSVFPEPSTLQENSGTLCICTVCNKYLHSQFLLELHQVRKMHSAWPRVNCTKCNQCFDSPQSPGDLAIHYRIHTCSSSMYACYECNGSETFCNLTGLIMHGNNAHGGQFSFMCQVCMRFHCSDALEAMSHIYMHHRETFLNCSVCHPCVEQEWPNSVFRCPLCPYRARLLYSLHVHLRSKHGAKGYKCENCGFSFETFSELRKHITENYRNPLQKDHSYSVQTVKNDMIQYGNSKMAALNMEECLPPGYY